MKLHLKIKEIYSNIANVLLHYKTKVEQDNKYCVDSGKVNIKAVS